MVTGQELGDGPGGTWGGPLLPLAQLTALVDGVHQQEERLLRGLNTQERQKDTSVGGREADVTNKTAWKSELMMSQDLMQNSRRETWFHNYGEQEKHFPALFLVPSELVPTVGV